MSNFLAEAQVLIRPDTSKFRAELLAQITAATRSLPPIPVPVVATTGAAAEGLTAQAAAATVAASSTESLAAAELQATGASAALDAQSKKTTASLLGLGAASGRLDAALLGLRTAVGSSAVIGLGAGALAAIAFGKALRASSDLAADFETQMNLLAATTGASADQINQAAEAARQLGEDASLPAVSAGDAAQAITELSKAGLDLQNSITGARGVLELATAASLDNAQATELAANALNAFGLAADQTTHVADLLANASIAAQGSIADVGLALQQSAAAAAQVGVSLDDTVVLLTLLAQGGLRASDAGTSLRVALLRLAAPTNAARAILRELNIQVRDTEGNIRPEVFAEFAQATSNLSPALRDAAAAAVFGQDAFRAFSLIAREGTVGLAQTRAELERQGAAADLAAAQTKGFAGAIGALQSEAETLGASLGQLINTSLLPVIGFLTDITGAANRAAEGLRKLAAVDLGPLGTVGKALGDLFKVIGPLAVFRLPVQGVKEFTNAVQGAGTITDQLTKKLGETKDALNLALATGRTDQVAELSRQIGALERALEALGGTAGRSLGRGILAASDVETNRAAQSLRARFDEIGDSVSRTAENSGEQIGKALGDGVKKGLDESVIAAINSAKANLLSIGSDLAAQLGQLIDAGPLGRQLQRLQESLTARQQARQRLGLVQDLEDAQRQLKLAQIDAGALTQELKKLQTQLDALRRTDATAGATAALRQAQTELREARESVTGVGRVTPTERRSINEFLAPFVENVRQAKSALQQQNLEGRIQKLSATIAKRRELFTEDEVTTAKRRVAAIQQAIRDFDDAAVIANLQKTVAAQKKTVADGIQNLLVQFNQGKIKLKDVNIGIANLLATSGVTAYGKAGTALGTAFRNKFVETLKGLRQQLQELATFAPQTPSGGAAVTVISPQQALIDFQKQQLSKQDTTNNLLQQIRDALKPRPAGKPTPGSVGSPR